jgi:hypothetical protein
LFSEAGLGSLKAGIKIQPLAGGSSSGSVVTNARYAGCQSAKIKTSKPRAAVFRQAQQYANVKQRINCVVGSSRWRLEKTMLIIFDTGRHSHKIASSATTLKARTRKKARVQPAV